MELELQLYVLTNAIHFSQLVLKKRNIVSVGVMCDGEVVHVT